MATLLPLHPATPAPALCHSTRGLRPVPWLSHLHGALGEQWEDMCWREPLPSPERPARARSLGLKGLPSHSTLL